ncbi:unnamed protein product [Meloidogyne enterolobii]|uniref:Uncharacterized protein n=1 Tax=Meloidogyne enterolobii TaxID=390850 RepID=A0ACB1ADP1_MELEN
MNIKYKTRNHPIHSLNLKTVINQVKRKRHRTSHRSLLYRQSAQNTLTIATREARPNIEN